MNYEYLEKDLRINNITYQDSDLVLKPTKYIITKDPLIIILCQTGILIYLILIVFLLVIRKKESDYKRSII